MDILSGERKKIILKIEKDLIKEKYYTLWGGIITDYLKKVPINEKSIAIKELEKRSHSIALINKIIKRDSDKNMKKYKTWEAIKMLSENPNLKFQLTDKNHHYSYLYIDTDIIEFKNYDKVSIAININDEWELIQEEVGILDAIKAFKLGKTIYCLYNQDKFIYDSNYYELKNNYGLSITYNEILNGHWYIQEDDKECEI